MIFATLLRLLQCTPPPAPNPADPNWLYSSVAQSSAAIVAIVGGLVANNVLNLTVRRKVLQDQLDELDARRALHSMEREAAVAEVDCRRLDSLFDHGLERIIDLDPFPSTLTQVRQRLEGTDISEEAFEARWEELCADIKLVEAALDDIGIDKDLGFEEWSKKHKQSLGRHGVGESWRTEWLARRRYSQKQSGDQRPWPPEPCGLGVVSGGRNVGARQRTLSSLQAPIQSAGNQESLTPEERKGELQAYRDVVAEQKRAISQIDARRVLLQELLEEVGSPPEHLWIGLVMLAVLAGTGIIVPLLLMPEASDDYQQQQWHKALVIGGFFIGLVLVFSYFAWLIVQATRRRDRS